MKGTEQFAQTIKAYLDKRAEQDELFAQSYIKPNKSIEECINYILGEVQKSGCNGFADEEIYGMAVHYYDEDDLKNIKPVQCKVVVNHAIELTEEEKQKAREKAIKRLEEETYQSMRKPAKKAQISENKATIEQGTLF